jgi:F-type H+-transporting ATPase subunit a
MSAALFNVARFFASEEGPHISLKAEQIGKFGPITYTNSMLYTLVVAAFILVLAWFIGRKVTFKPQKGIVQLLEIPVEFVIDMLEGIFGNRKQAVKFAPIFSVYFIFIMVSNLSGLMPFVGHGIVAGEFPAFRPFTADLNGVIAMAIFSIVAVQVLSIREQGLKGHMQHFFSDKPKNPINFFVGILEVLGEFTRIISLSLRLFLNTVIGEILISVFIFISGNATPLTLIVLFLFEGLVAYIQAYIFTVLSATYLGLAVAHHHDEEHEKSIIGSETDPSHFVHPSTELHASKAQK